MRTELEQERRMATNDRFGDAAGETARRLEDMKRRRKREALRNGAAVLGSAWPSIAGKATDNHKTGRNDDDAIRH